MDKGFVINGLKSRIPINKMGSSYYIKQNLVNKYKFDEEWRVSMVQNFRNSLYNLGYKVVIFTDVDEIIAPDPDKYTNLKVYLEKFIKSKDTYVNCSGWEIYSYKDAPLINYKEKILSQRTIWYKNWMYNKPAIAKSTDIYEWSKGFHKRTDGKYNGDKDLILIHLNRIDYISSLKRFIKNNTLVYNPEQEPQPLSQAF